MVTAAFYLCYTNLHRHALAPVLATALRSGLLLPCFTDEESKACGKVQYIEQGQREHAAVLGLTITPLFIHSLNKCWAEQLLSTSN